MARKRRRSYKPLWLVLVLALVGYRGWQQDWQLELPKGKAPEKATKVFAVLPNARLHESPNNDGDSFKLAHKGEVHEFRLYFADCPEKRRHRYNAERLTDQGRYFGGLSEDQTVAIGQRAQSFTYELLTSQPFTVYTKWQAVYDSGRFYAFVIFADGEDLSAKLVRAGLARIHTGGTTLPDGRQSSAYQQQLKKWEAEARQSRKGGWAYR